MQTRSIMRATVAFMADDALARALVRAADRTGRSRSSYARHALAEHLRQDGYLKAPVATEATA